MASRGRGDSSPNRFSKRRGWASTRANREARIEFQRHTPCLVQPTAKIGSPNYQSLYRSASTGPESIQGPIGRRDKSRAQRLSHDRRRARLAAWSAWMQVASPIAPEGVAAAGRRLELLRQRMMMRHPRLHRKALRWRMELLKQKMIMRLRRQRPRRLERSRLQ